MFITNGNQEYRMLHVMAGETFLDHAIAEIVFKNGLLIGESAGKYKFKFDSCIKNIIIFLKTDSIFDITYNFTSYIHLKIIFKVYNDDFMDSRH